MFVHFLLSYAMTIIFVRLDTVRVVVALAAQKEWTIHQLDVKSAFLHGEVDEEVFVEQPPGYMCREVRSRKFTNYGKLYMDLNKPLVLGIVV